MELLTIIKRKSRERTDEKTQLGTYTVYFVEFIMLCCYVHKIDEVNLLEDLFFCLDFVFRLNFFFARNPTGYPIRRTRKYIY